MEIYLESTEEEGLNNQEIVSALKQSIEGKNNSKVLIIPPDITRFYSNAGYITNQYYHLLTENGCKVDILIALGTHDPMNAEQFHMMYGDIPFEVVIPHRWRVDCETLGEVPGSYLKNITEGLWETPIKVEVNRKVMDPSYDMVLSIGQVVPHEVIGMSNHAKNIFVGVGGSEMINQSHMVGAVYGMERMMGKDYTPVRKMFDYALENYLSKLNIVFVLTVTTAPQNRIYTHGLFIGKERNVLRRAVALSQKKNIDFVQTGIQKCVVYLDPKEFHSTWLGNKAIYRTRMAMADGGKLVILAPGVRKFGEDPECDRIIRKYGYCGRLRMLELFKNNQDLAENMAVAAHLIHGSSDGRFQIVYAVKEISREEIESVHFESADYDEMIKKYDPQNLKYGYNKMPDGEEIFFVPNPALGLWIDKSIF